MDVARILDTLDQMFPDAHCELNHRNAYELCVAVVLSAQTTDVSVNKATPALFEKYPSAKELASAEQSDVEACIKKIGLYRSKAKNIIGLAQYAVEHFNGEIPNTMEQLIQLPGVGRKSANVVLSVCFGVPAFAVDTHVERISKRLGFARKNDTVWDVERKLMKKIPKDRWNDMHHKFIFFGRYFCKAKNPSCKDCLLVDICKEKDKKI